MNSSKDPMHKLAPYLRDAYFARNEEHITDASLFAGEVNGPLNKSDRKILIAFGVFAGCAILCAVIAVAASFSPVKHTPTPEATPKSSGSNIDLSFQVAAINHDINSPSGFNFIPAN